MSIPLIALGASLIGLAYALYLMNSVLKQPVGTTSMQEIAHAIQQGAKAFMNRQLKTITVFALILCAIIAFSLDKGEHFNSYVIALGFIIGAFLSALAGYLGMSMSVRANIRTTTAAKKDIKSALKVAFKGGAFTGFAVVGCALLGVTGMYMLLSRTFEIPIGETPQLLIGFGFGASLVSLFARVGGGIFTKAADVGADLVGKVEKGIPEDDPRNPAVIADNVGDNVGDCAGMGADLFETYAVTIIAAMILATSTANKLMEKATMGFTENKTAILIEYPLVLGAIAIIASIIGSFFVKLGKNGKIMHALYKGIFAASVLSAIGFYVATDRLLHDKFIFLATLVGLIITVLFNMITEYYTSTLYKPVQKIAYVSQTGAGTNIITGLAVGLKSTLPTVIVIILGILAAYMAGAYSSLENGIYGIAIAAVAMLSSTGLVIAIDAYGPITDNAGGIAEMAGLPEAVRENTDALDAVGNTTKAVTKGYAIGSAALAALVLFQAYNEELGKTASGELIFALNNYQVIIGLFVGGMLPALFSSLCMEAVGQTAHKVVEEVRRQFREIKGIMQGKEKPDYSTCVDIVTKASLKQMVAPGLIAILSPILVGLIFGPKALGGLLVGVIITGLLMAIQMCNGGGAWDNAKKFIEKGNFGGKGSDAHKAAVVGDTVGDPYKDTAGPALNALIKVINTIALIIAPVVGAYSLLS